MKRLMTCSRVQCLICCVALVALLSACRDPGASAVPPVASPSEVGPRRVDVETFAQAREDADALVVDVRTPAEFAQGHIPGAINLDVNAPDFPSAIRQLERGRPVLVYCRSGRRSARACAILQETGFTQLKDLESGLQGWEASGRPVER